MRLDELPRSEKNELCNDACKGKHPKECRHRWHSTAHRLPPSDEVFHNVLAYRPLQTPSALEISAKVAFSASLT